MLDALAYYSSRTAPSYDIHALADFQNQPTFSSDQDILHCQFLQYHVQFQLRCSFHFYNRFLHYNWPAGVALLWKVRRASYFASTTWSSENTMVLAVFPPFHYCPISQHITLNTGHSIELNYIKRLLFTLWNESWQKHELVICIPLNLESLISTHA